MCIDTHSRVCYNTLGGDPMIKDRIKEVRKSNKLSQTDFGKSLGVSRDIIANLETGRVEPTELIKKSISNEFGIRLEWLENGEGEMMQDLSRDAEISEYVGRILATSEDTFQKRLIAALSKLSVEEWEVLEKLANDLASSKKEQD